MNEMENIKKVNIKKLRLLKVKKWLNACLVVVDYAILTASQSSIGILKISVETSKKLQAFTSVRKNTFKYFVHQCINL